MAETKAIKYLKKAVSKLKGLHLPSTTATANESSQPKPQCYAICIDNLGPIQIPTWYTLQLQNEKTNHKIGKIEISLFCSIFDSDEQCFVGRTWKSEAFQTKINNETIPISKFWLYFKSIPNDSKWIVLELVSQIRSEGVVIKPVSLGWTVIQLFANIRALIDVHPCENNSDPLQRESKLKTQFLFQGSPTYLLLNKDIHSIPETAIKIGFRLFTFKKLTNISHLLCSETVIGAKNIIAGMGHSLCIPSNPFDKVWLAIFDTKATDFIISSPILKLNDGFESDVVTKLSKVRKNNVCGNDHTIAQIIDRHLNIAVYNGRNTITAPTIIQLQRHSTHSSVLCWNGDIKMRVNAQLSDECWFLLSLNYSIEWRDSPLSVHSPSHHHKVCLGRALVNITSNKLVLNGSQPTQLILTPNYSWIDDCPMFNNIKSNTKHRIETSFIIRMLSAANESIQPSTKSTDTFAETIMMDPLSSTSKSHTFVHTTPQSRDSNNVLPTPQGYVAMNWDDIKKQSLMIPNNVLSHTNKSELGLLQESFAVNAWHKMNKQSLSHTYPNCSANAKVLKQSLHGPNTNNNSIFDIIPNRKVIDFEQELSLSHQRTFSICCTSLNILAKHLLLNPIRCIVIQLDFMGEKVRSDVITLSVNTTINALRESLMSEDKYESIPFIQSYTFEFNILPKQIRQFIEFCNKKYAIFTIFNADTMFQIGSLRLCLRDFLIQNKCENNNFVKQSIEIPIILTKITNESKSIIETQPTNLASLNNGHLCLEISHKCLDLTDTQKLQYTNWSQSLITNTCDENGEMCVRGLRLLQCKNKRIRAQILYENPKLCSKLESLPPNYARVSYPLQSIKTKWKVPIEAIHQISVSEYDNCDKSDRLRRENIETMKDFRNRKKQEMLSKLSKSDQFIIQPCFGQSIFFEIEFENPFTEKKKFEINIINDDDHQCLKLVTDISELSYLKEKYGVAHTKMKRHLFDLGNEKMNEIICTAHEKIYIPFAFQSFETQISARTITVCINDISEFNNHCNHKCIAEFHICVEPNKFCVDRIFDIFTFEKCKFMCDLPLPPLYNLHTKYSEHILAIQCSDNKNIAFEFDKNKENLTFRCDIEQSIKNEKKSFYFIIYNDRYCVNINEIWEINICAYLNETCHGMLGGLIKHSIDLPNTNNNNNDLSFFCDEQNGIQLQQTMENNKNVLNMEYAPTEIGKKLIKIHGINSNNNKVCFKCLLLIHIEMPKINNSFIIHIDSESEYQNSEIITRKLPYKNGYNQSRNYELISNEPSIIRINNPILQINSQCSAEFILQIMPKNIGNIHSKEVLLFVTECGNLEQCLRIEVKKGKLTNL